jgi:hypothetical protein
MKDITLDALTRLSRRTEDMRAALKEIQKRERAQAKADRLRLEALIGFAVLADLEARSDDTAGVRRAYICEVLDRHIENNSSRSFVRTKGFGVPTASAHKG